MSGSAQVASDEIERAGIQLGRIMVAYDFSAFADTALAYARSFARSFGAEVLLVYAEDPRSEGDDSLSAMRAAHQEHVDEMKLAARRLVSEGVRCTTICRSGNPSDVLVQVAAECKPDLLILGAYSRTRSGKERLGSTAEYTLRSVRCATLTIGPQAMLMAHPGRRLGSLVYASSFPDKVGQPLRVAEAIALACDAEVEVAHVIERGPAAPGADESRLGREAERMVAYFRSAGVHAHSRLLEGRAGSALADRAAGVDAGLILFGVEQVGSSWSAGAAIRQTIQRATCPVLTVPGAA